MSPILKQSVYNKLDSKNPARTKHLLIDRTSIIKKKANERQWDKIFEKKQQTQSPTPNAAFLHIPNTLMHISQTHLCAYPTHTYVHIPHTLMHISHIHLCAYTMHTYVHTPCTLMYIHHAHLCMYHDMRYA